MKNITRILVILSLPVNGFIVRTVCGTNVVAAGLTEAEDDDCLDELRSRSPSLQKDEDKVINKVNFAKLSHQ